MSVVTNRMYPQTVAVDNSKQFTLWGDGYSGVLNGGTKATCTVDVPVAAAPNNLVVTIWVKSTSQSAWVADATTVTCPHSVSTKIDLTEIVGYAIKLTGQMSAGGPYSIGVSGQVML